MVAGPGWKGAVGRVDVELTWGMNWGLGMRGTDGTGTIDSIVAFLVAIDGCEGMVGSNMAGLSVKNGGMTGNSEELER